jgi:hypothetical protein
MGTNAGTGMGTTRRNRHVGAIDSRCLRTYTSASLQTTVSLGANEPLRCFMPAPEHRVAGQRTLNENREVLR